HAERADRLAGAAHLVDLFHHRRALRVAAARVEGVRVGAGVDLADARADARRRLDLRELRVDEYASDDAGIGEARDRFAQLLLLADDVEAALGGHFLAALGNQHRHLRADVARDRHHLLGRRHLEVELNVRELAQPPYVRVLDVAPVFAQVHGDAVRAAQVRLHRGPHRIRLV